MDSSSPQPNNPEQNTTNSGLRHEKVILPSQSLLEELGSAQPITQQQPISHITPQATPLTINEQQLPIPKSSEQSSLSTNTQQLQSTVTHSSIYPEATQGMGILSPTPLVTNASDELEAARVKSKFKTLVVRVIAASIILVSGTNSYYWYVAHGAGYSNWISMIEIVVMLGLAIGIFLLNEVARSIYVVVSAAMLILSVINIISFYSISSHSYSAISNTQALPKSLLEKNLIAEENDKSLSAIQKEEMIQETKKELSAIPSSSDALITKPYFSEGLNLIVSIIPLIFLTRPAVKAIFK
jgi:hypothetical protein